MGYTGNLMAKHGIISVPDKRLRQHSRRVGVITPEVDSVIERMKSATLNWEEGRTSEVGVALAAVQIGELDRIVIIRLNPDDKDSHEFEVFLNPEITKKEGQIVTEPEGCLSIPDTYGLVPRYETVRISAIGLDGRPVRLKLHGFLARVFQHEVDHLHGKLFVDHVDEDSFFKIMEDGKLEPLTKDQLDASRLLWHR